MTRAELEGELTEARRVGESDNMPPKRTMSIRLSRHAVQRWNERVGMDKPESIKGHIRRAIMAALRRGVLMDKYGAAIINVKPGLKAVIAPSARGGWEVLTVWVEQERREKDEVQLSRLQ